jgi:hypothetical protein
VTYPIEEGVPVSAEGGERAARGVGSEDLASLDRPYSDFPPTGTSSTFANPLPVTSYTVTLFASKFARTSSKPIRAEYNIRRPADLALRRMDIGWDTTQPSFRKRSLGA